MNNTRDVRMNNSLLVLKEFMTLEKYTKAEMSKKVNLTLVTTGKIINKLLDNGVIIETGIAESVYGRKASEFSLNLTRYFVCGISIDIGKYYFEILDLGMSVVYYGQGSFDCDSEPEIVLDLVCKSIKEGLIKTKIDSNDIAGIGITVPGIVSPSTGKIQILPNMPNWENIDIKTYFQRSLNVLTIVEKDNYASILYLKTTQKSKLSNAILLTIKGGIGCGILVQGSIYRGANCLAGEVGHVVFENEGKEDDLEGFASNIAILAKIRERMVKSVEIPDSIESAIDMANNGNEICLEVFRDALKFLCKSLIIIIRLYDPKHIFLDSIWVSEVTGMHKNIISTINDIKDTLPSVDVKIKIIKNRKMIEKGASMLIFDYITNNSKNNKLII